MDEFCASCHRGFAEPHSEDCPENMATRSLRAQILQAFDVTEEDMGILDGNGYAEAKIEADRQMAEFEADLMRWAAALGLSTEPLLRPSA